MKEISALEVGEKPQIINLKKIHPMHMVNRVGIEPRTPKVKDEERLTPQTGQLAAGCFILFSVIVGFFF